MKWNAAMNKLLLSTLAVAAAAVTLVSCSRESTPQSALQDVSSITTFKLGLDDSFPPMGFRDENHEVVGYDIDLAREVCKRRGWELVPTPIDWNTKELSLDSGEIDCIWNGFTMTEERKKALCFTPAYLENAQILVVRADSPVKTLADLAGKRVEAQAGSSAMDAIDSNPEFKASLREVIGVKENLTALMELESGTVDAVCIDLVVGQDSIRRSGKDFRVLDEALAPEQYGIGFKKGNDALMNAVWETLCEMAADGTVAKIDEKWFGREISTIPDGK